MNELVALVLEQVRGMWRFRWIALGMAWLVAVVGWLYVYNLPSQYTSRARVHIDTKSAIQPLLNGLAVKPNASRRVALLIKTVKSTPHLKTIARKSGLGLDADDPAEKQALVAKLDSRIKIHGSGRKTDLYSIRYTGDNAQSAHAVVQQTINIMTSMAGMKNPQNSGRAVAFLQNQVQGYEKKLNKTEHRLSSFKKEHASLMPGKNDYVARLNNLNASIDSIQDQLATAKSQRQRLQNGASGSQTATVPATQSRQVQALDQRINKTQNRIDQLLVRYTPKHPDVVDAKKRLSRLEDKRSKAVARLRAHPEERQRVTSNGNNRQAVLGKANAHIQTLQAKLERKQGKINKLKQGADEMTDAQAKLAKLSRNYQATKTQYQKLLTRLYSAQLSGEVQRHTNPVKFNIVDPPETPAEPSGPKRVVLMTMVLFASLVAGGAFAFVVSQLRPVFINRKALVAATGLPVLGTVSLGLTPGQRRRRHAAFTLFAIGATTLFVGFVGAVLFMPIGVRMMPTLMTGLPI